MRTSALKACRVQHTEGIDRDFVNCLIACHCADAQQPEPLVVACVEGFTWHLKQVWPSALARDLQNLIEKFARIHIRVCTALF